jgi:hypothetical protein
MFVVPSMQTVMFLNFCPLHPHVSYVVFCDVIGPSSLLCKLVWVRKGINDTQYECGGSIRPSALILAIVIEQAC